MKYVFGPRIIDSIDMLVADVKVDGIKIAVFQPDGEFSTYTYIRKDITNTFSAYSICLWISLYRFRGNFNVPMCYGNTVSPDLLFIGRY